MDTLTTTERKHDLQWIIDFWKDGETWMQGDAWDRVAVTSEYAAEAGAAADALRRVFPWTWLKRFCLGAEHIGHPVIMSHVIIGNIRILLELGTMLARKPEVLEHVRKRLRLPREFATASAEVRAGLLLSDAEAELVHEPLGKALGPDWHATWRGRRFAVEVKHPETSQRAELASAVISTFIMKLRTDRLPTPTEGAWLRLHASDALVRLCLTNNRVNDRTIEELVARAEHELAARLPRPTRNVRLDMPGFGTFEVLTGLDGKPRFQPTAYGPKPDARHEISKLIPLLEKGARQLAASPLQTRILVLDVGRDRSIGNYGAELHALLDEPWAASISALVLLGSLNSELQECIDVLVRHGQEHDFEWLGDCLGLSER